MVRKYQAINANVGDTKRPTVVGADRHPGWNAVRRIATRITTPLLPDDYLRLANPLWSARELRGRVLAVHRETEDSATLVIKPGWGFHFDYAPGQYIGIGLLVDGRWRWRSYSLTSPPTTEPGRSRTITITVKAMPEGFLSSHLVDGVDPGTIVRLAAPQGEFVLPDPVPATVLFLTAGSGITPVMSMLRTLARRGGITDVIHVHSAPTADDALFADELAALHRDHPGYRLVLRTTRDQGRLDLSGPGTLDAEVPDWRDRQTWACGPGALLADAERLWAQAGITDRLHVERFAAVRTVAADGGGTVTFGRSGKSVAADAATTLLEAGEGAGVQLPFGCRMGICQSCVVELVDGHVRDLRNGAEHEPGSRIQTCVCAAAGDCTLDV
ncbi:ferredoxin reductase [Mycobacterium sp. M1]|uniref:Ferredoxin reductase n=1 Tax=Mycolicibacter acidiphilus TaxID=2835306 RepID=A0ABS5RKN1_9MYCO|nr:ferredoxin reductase [Mycolicibacter acidiphilus]MBS9534847.1 ferredoxin reductase [Mycolicibacter acidiphilus]